MTDLSPLTVSTRRLTRFLTMKEAAAALGINPKTMWLWINRSKKGPPTYRIGGRIYLDRDEFEVWVNQHRREN